MTRQDREACALRLLESWRSARSITIARSVDDLERDYIRCDHDQPDGLDYVLSDDEARFIVWGEVA